MACVVTWANCARPVEKVLAARTPVRNGLSYIRSLLSDLCSRSAPVRAATCAGAGPNPCVTGRPTCGFAAFETDANDVNAVTLEDGQSPPPFHSVDYASTIFLIGLIAHMSQLATRTAQADVEYGLIVDVFVLIRRKGPPPASQVEDSVRTHSRKSLTAPASA